ncbi:MAG: hypothetical protein KDD92_11160 [Caldilineaceae bacterium]|nr:hypothetical protein [Caldilineaceae bacterium]
MSEESKIEITIGNLTFKGEGTESWLSTQLDKILDKAEALLAVHLELDSTQPTQNNDNGEDEGESASVDNEIASKHLATFLKEKNASSPQVNKFLATAIWLHARGKRYLSTKDVTEALRNAQQSRLSNASDCLNKNVGKGFCEKHGSQFFVTPQGKKAI